MLGVEQNSKSIFLIGFMGSGKSRIGKLLAKKLHCPFYDLDQILVDSQNRSISSIFLENGEAYFRQLETQTLKETSKKPIGVISLGGGTPCYKSNWAYINFKQTVYLKSSRKDLAQRLWKERGHRPLVSTMTSKKELYTKVDQLLTERSPYYNQASIKVWNRGALENVVHRILAKL